MPVDLEVVTRGSPDGSDGLVCKAEQWGKSLVSKAREA